MALIGTDEERIFKEVDRLLHDQDHYDSMANAVNPYGDGMAAEAASRGGGAARSRLRDGEFTGG